MEVIVEKINFTRHRLTHLHAEEYYVQAKKFVVFCTGRFPHLTHWSRFYYGGNMANFWANFCFMGRWQTNRRTIKRVGQHVVLFRLIAREMMNRS